MNRGLYFQLRSWKNSPRRKPLILQGARQVGKTHLLKEFGTKEYKDLAYFNFESDRSLNSLFETKKKIDPKRMIENLGIYREKPITSKTLLVLDEIQESPSALNALKYFQEEIPEYHIACAGSLLGIVLGKKASFPVGKVNFLKMYPMLFSEFLDAMGKNKLVRYLAGIQKAAPIPEAFHFELLEMLKVYLFVGGMPECVASYIEHREVTEVREIQKEILNSYLLDLAKHADATSVLKVRQVWEIIPAHLAKENKKFTFSAIKKSARAREYEDALQWLLDAGLVLKSNLVSKPGIPLSGYADISSFKIYLLDVGLLGAASDLNPKILLRGNDLFTEFKGSLTENYVAQHLVGKHLGPLFYWASSGQAEVDFLSEHEGSVYPLEVKAGASRHKQSLLEYAKKYSCKTISRTTSMNLQKEENLVNFPLYMIERFPLLC